MKPDSTQSANDPKAIPTTYPTTDPETPTTDPETPTTDPETPTTDPETPMADPETPKAYPKAYPKAANRGISDTSASGLSRNPDIYPQSRYYKTRLLTAYIPTKHGPTR